MHPALWFTHVHDFTLPLRSKAGRSPWALASNGMAMSANAIANFLIVFILLCCFIVYTLMSFASMIGYLFTGLAKILNP